MDMHLRYAITEYCSPRCQGNHDASFFLWTLEVKEKAEKVKEPLKKKTKTKK